MTNILEVDWLQNNGSRGWSGWHIEEGYVYLILTNDKITKLAFISGLSVKTNKDKTCIKLYSRKQLITFCDILKLIYKYKSYEFSDNIDSINFKGNE